jgi:hypothetical protein
MVDRRLALDLRCLTSVQSYADQIRSESTVLHLGIPPRPRESRSLRYVSRELAAWPLARISVGTFPEREGWAADPTAFAL